MEHSLIWKTLHTAPPREDEPETVALPGSRRLDMTGGCQIVTSHCSYHERNTSLQTQQKQNKLLETQASELQRSKVSLKQHGCG